MGASPDPFHDQSHARECVTLKITRKPRGGGIGRIRSVALSGSFSSLEPFGSSVRAPPQFSRGLTSTAGSFFNASAVLFALAIQSLM